MLVDIYSRYIYIYIVHIYVYMYRHIRVVNMMVTNNQKCGRETSPMESPVEAKNRGQTLVISTSLIGGILTMVY